MNVRVQFYILLAAIALILVGVVGLVEQHINQSDEPRMIEYNLAVRWCAVSVAQALVAQGAPQAEVQAQFPVIWNQCSENLESFIMSLEEGGEDDG